MTGPDAFRCRADKPKGVGSRRAPDARRPDGAALRRPIFALAWGLTGRAGRYLPPAAPPHLVMPVVGVEPRRPGLAPHDGRLQDAVAGGMPHSDSM